MLPKYLTIGQFIEKIVKEFLKLEKPTPEIMKVLIHKIEINQNKQVDIVFNFKKLQMLSKIQN